MKILHYSLGLPPYRSGGLTKYSMDLMLGELEEGNEIFLLFPGHYSLLKEEPKIKSYSNYKGIEVFELVNPLPVPLLGGVGNPKAFMKPTKKELYVKFLKEVNPEVIHVHTLMGLHKEFIEAANILNINTYFTTHDYYGLCPRVNFLNEGGNVCKDFHQGKGCISCNVSSYSMKTIKVMQSRSYRSLKENPIVKKLRKIKKASYHKEVASEENEIKEVKNFSSIDSKEVRGKDYYDLRKFYITMMTSFTKIHFNSTLAEEIYKTYGENLKGQVIPISHGDIKDNRKLKTYGEDESLNITYLGPVEKYKGIYLLLESLNVLYAQGIKNWSLNIYGDNKTVSQYENHENIKFHGRYSYKELKDILDKSHVVVVPSIWWETFGLITLEALSFGVPVVVTTNVGAKDLVERGYGLVVEPKIENLSSILKDLIKNRKLLKDLNSKICKDDFNLDMKNHVKAMLRFYGV